MSCCLGVTKKGVKCTRTVRSTFGYCFQHTNQMTGSTDRYYTPPAHDGWPALSEIRSLPNYKLCSSEEDFKNVLVSSMDYDYESLLGYAISKNKRLLIFFCELTLLNKDILTLDDWQPFVKKIQEKLSIVRELNPYVDVFHKTLDNDYLMLKLKAKRTYIEFFFRKSELGPHIAKCIADAYDDRPGLKK